MDEIEVKFRLYRVFEDWWTDAHPDVQKVLIDEFDSPETKLAKLRDHRRAVIRVKHRLDIAVFTEVEITDVQTVARQLTFSNF